MPPQSHLSGGSWFDGEFYQGGHDLKEIFIRGLGPAGRVNPACIRLWMMRTCAPCLLICEQMLRLSWRLKLRWMRCCSKIYVKMNSINGVFDTIFWPLKPWLRWNGGIRFFSRGCVPNLIFLAGGAFRTSIFYQGVRKSSTGMHFHNPKVIWGSALWIILAGGCHSGRSKTLPPIPPD